jgi:hypothetical protein
VSENFFQRRTLCSLDFEVSRFRGFVESREKRKLIDFFKMNQQTIEQPRRQSTRADGCHATKEELREDGMKVMEDCPICEKRGILCEVGCHPTSSVHSVETDRGSFLNRFSLLYFLTLVLFFFSSLIFSVKVDLINNNIGELWVGVLSLARSLLSATDSTEEKFLSTHLKNMESSTVPQNLSSHSLKQFSSAQSFPELLPSSATACAVEVIPKISYHTSKSPTNELRQRKVLK